MNRTDNVSDEKVSRRAALGAGLALAGGALLRPRIVTAAEMPATRPMPGVGPRSTTGPLPTSRPGRFDKYLRDTTNMAWRKKMVPGSTLERIYSQIERLDPDNPLPPGLPGVDYKPVVTPNNISMPFEIRGGVKVMHMVAEEVKHKFADGIECYTWGYNGRTHGPTIEAVEGERLRIYVTNKLPAPTTVHWHGFVLPHGMDGVSGLEQPSILPGETFKYEWTVRQHGTYMYHSHHDTMTQEGMGLIGMFIVHPRRELYAPDELGPEVDRDFAIMLSQWHVDVGASRPNPWSMEYNLLTMNAVVSPFTEPLITRLDDRVRVRFGNLSAIHHHPIHLHGYQFVTTAVDGWRVLPENQEPAVTVFMPVGRTRDLEIVANNEGDWIFHCHMTHHIMNQMNSNFPNTMGMSSDADARVREVLPDYMTMGAAGMNDRTGKPMAPVPTNSIPMKEGRGPYGVNTVAGMANVLKVRSDVTDADLAANRDPGYYYGPKRTTALPATREELARDGIIA